MLVTNYLLYRSLWFLIFCKLKLGKINKEITLKFELNQWKNTDLVIDWFKHIKNKNLYKFAIIDIKEFYPSIKECILKNDISFLNNILKYPKKTEH